MLTVQFISEPPHDQWGVEVTWFNQRPTAVLNRLRDLGWVVWSVQPQIPNNVRFAKPYDIARFEELTAVHKIDRLAVRRAMEPFGIHNISHKKLR